MLHVSATATCLSPLFLQSMKGVQNRLLYSL